MGKIVFLDDNQASSAFLKIILGHHWHRVTRAETIQEVVNYPTGSTPSLVSKFQGKLGPHQTCL